MSKLGSLYIRLGEPEGELSGCCETADWAADYIADGIKEIRFLREKTADHYQQIENLSSEIKYLKDRLAQQDVVNRLQCIKIKELQQEIDKQDEVIDQYNQYNQGTN